MRSIQGSNVEFFSPARRDPYVQRIVHLEHANDKGKLTFDGYYRTDTRYYPIETILQIDDKMYHIEIIKKMDGEDTSTYSDIEEPNGDTLRVCFFPTRLLTIEYEILVEIESSAYFGYTMNRLEQLDSIREKRIEHDYHEEWRRNTENWKMTKEDSRLREYWKKGKSIDGVSL